MSRRIEEFQRQILEQMAATNAKLDKLAAVLLSSQLLEECVSREGNYELPKSARTLLGKVFALGFASRKN
jgi:DNA-binding FrmR family transcriptional regulator